MQIGVGIGIPPFHFGGGDPVLALFTNGEQGGYYDPSSMDGQFVDNLGTTPVTAAGDQVGLKMDKRLWGGRTLAQVVAAQPELVVNGSFAANVSGWTASSGATIGWNASGAIDVTRASAATERAYQAFSTVAGRLYRLSFDAAPGSFTASARLGTTATGNEVGVLSEPVAGAGGSATGYFFALGSTTYVSLAISGNATRTFDNVSVKEIPGNHRFQATAASRSILAREPVGGRRNLLVNTEEFNTTWAVQRCTVGVNAIAAPNGTLTADALVEDNQNGGRQFYQFFAKASSSIQYTYSIFVKPALRTWIRLFPSTGGEVNGASQYYNLSGAGSLGSGSVAGSGFTNHGATITALPDGWYYLTLTFTTDANTAVNINAKGSTGDGLNTYQGVDGSTAFYLWGAQLELGSVATAYQRVGNTHDVTEAGKRDCWFWFYDGTDDGDATGNVDFSGGDELFASFGVRKFSDAAVALIAELSSALSGNVGSFGLFTNAPNGFPWQFQPRGSAAAGSGQIAYTSGAAPETAVITGLADISSDLSRLRKDGVSGTDGTGDQGSGNFGNYPLYFGRRGGTVYPFSGREYLTVIRAGIPSADQITAVERLIADRQGRTI